MTRALILGGGMVGSAMAMDLAADPGAADSGAADSNMEVTVADISKERLALLSERFGVAGRVADLSDAAQITALASEFDIVLGALSSHLGLAALAAVIDSGTNYVDISFMSEDALPLHKRAVERGVVAVVDCGVAPGMSNMISGYGARLLDPCEKLEIYVGGLPELRQLPFEYKAGFAPADVLEEYTRPARMVEHGEVVTYPALSGPELLEFPGVGTLEAFNTDGLRSLISTLDVPTMIEKTMRYPGHIELMRVMRHMGLFSKEPVEVDGQMVVPLNLTSALLFPKWTFEDDEVDITVMRIVATGMSGGQRCRHQWDLYDRYDPKTKFRSMSRTTAFPATIVARMVARGDFAKPGVHPPEVLGQQDGVLEHVLGELEQRGVHYEHKVEQL